MKTAIFLMAGLMVGLSAPVNAEPPTVLCPTPNPDAWVNYCVTVTSRSRNVYTVDSGNLVYTEVCPGPDTCIDVPTLPSILATIVPTTVNVLSVSTSGTNVNGQQLIGDICTIVFGGPQYCNVNPEASASFGLTDLNGDGIIDGIVVDQLLLPLLPA